MPTPALKTALIATLITLMSCTNTQQTTAVESPATATDNPLLASWSGPYGGVPAFDKMEVSALAPAMEAAMAMSLAEIDAIAENPEPPTFANTIEAMEGAGKELSRVFSYWGIFRSNVSTPESREVMAALAPKVSGYFSNSGPKRTLPLSIPTVNG